MEDGYQNTISGLLRKRVAMLAELEELKNQIAHKANDLRSLDRVLLALGHVPTPDHERPPRKRVLMFIRNEMRRFILAKLRESDVPLSSRELAEMIAEAEGKDTDDRKLIVDITKRVSKAVCHLLDKKAVRRVIDESGRKVYELAGPD